MKQTTLGALILLAIGVVTIFLWQYLSQRIKTSTYKETSDASSIEETVRIGGDNYLGYWFLTSPEFRKHLGSEGMAVDFHDDGGAYAERLEKFAKGEYDAIVLPVNSYLQHGASHSFPGVVVAAISESKGADGIVCRDAAFPKDGKINSLNNPNIKIAYTAESPSSFLVDLLIADFDLNQLKNSKAWKVELGSSRDVYDYIRNGGEAQVFVLWEPDLSKALEIPGVRYLWGSDKFSGYIVDVLVFRRDFVKDRYDSLLKFLKIYFRAMSIYGNNRVTMLEAMSASAQLGKDKVESMIKKIEWFDLGENARSQFGVGDGPTLHNDGLMNTILACTNVMLRMKSVTEDPLSGNPYSIVNSNPIKDLINNKNIGTLGVGTSVQKFEVLTDEGWGKLREVGTMRVEPITFQLSVNMLSDEGKLRVDGFASMLINNYPNYRVVVKGHTAPGGDEAENVKLSLERALAVIQRLSVVHKVDPNRLKAVGDGSSLPLPRGENESPREHRYRLSRVEFILFEPNPF